MTLEKRMIIEKLNDSAKKVKCIRDIYQQSDNNQVLYRLLYGAEERVCAQYEIAKMFGVTLEDIPEACKIMKGKFGASQY